MVTARNHFRRCHFSNMVCDLKLLLILPNFAFDPEDLQRIVDIVYEAPWKIIFHIKL